MGRYESCYFRAVHPERALGLWVRHTHHVMPDGSLRGARWMTLFEPGRVTARKERFEGRPAADGRRFAGKALDSQWDVEVEPLTPPFRYLPKPWMYRAPLPKTKPVSLAPLAVFRGAASLAGRRILLDGWRGMVGRNWGSEHAHRWVWLHVAGFDGAPEAWLDLVLARVKIGPFVTGWIANGAIELAGRRERLGGLPARTEVDAQVGHARIVVRGTGIEVETVVEAPSDDSIVVWQYGDPGGGKRYVANCSIARASVRVSGPPGGQKLTAAHSAAYELGMSEAPAGRSLQPYPDP